MPRPVGLSSHQVLYSPCFQSSAPDLNSYFYFSDSDLGTTLSSSKDCGAKDKHVTKQDVSF